MKITIRTATLHDCWPTNVAEIALAYETNDVVEEFDCTFRFNYMTLSGAGGAASGSWLISNTKSRRSFLDRRFFVVLFPL